MLLQPSLRQFVSVLGLLILSACPRVAPHPIVHGRELLGAEKETILISLSAKDDQLKTFRGIARVRRETKGTPAFRQALIFKKPHSLRLEALPLDSAYTIYLIVGRERSLTLLDVQSKDAYQSNNERSLFGRITKLPFGMREAMSLFTGQVPSTELNEGTVLFLDESSSSIYVKNRNDVSFYVVDKATLLLKMAEFRNQFDGKLVGTLKYSYKADNSLNDMEMKLDSAPENNAVFKWTSYQSNVDVNDSLFEISIPSEYSTRSIGR